MAEGGGTHEALEETGDGRRSRSCREPADSSPGRGHSHQAHIDRIRLLDLDELQNGWRHDVVGHGRRYVEGAVADDRAGAHGGLPGAPDEGGGQGSPQGALQATQLVGRRLISHIGRRNPVSDQPMTQ